MSAGSVTQGFAEGLLRQASAGLSAAAARRCGELVCDGLAVGALGAGEAPPRHLAALAAEAGGAPESTLLAQGLTRVPPVAAARVNGAAMHVLDFEPMWNPANHSLSTTLPALLALAEALARRGGAAPDGARLLLALAVGVEAQERLRIASAQFEPGSFLFHPPGMVGAMGAAAACGVLLGLDAGRLAHALGIAASRAGGVIANVGSMVKCLHCGDAAAGGLEAALLAARGFTADADAIGSPRGWGRAFSGAAFRAEALTEPMGEWLVAAPGPAFKLYPSQYGTHFVIAAALAARAGWDGRGAIARATITAPAMAYVDRPIPASGLAGKFSFQYTAAAALLDGRVGVDSFADARRFAPDMEALLPRIAVLPDAAREGRFDRMRVDVEVGLADGTRLHGACDGPPGIWGRPVAEAALQAKWSDCLDAAFGADDGPGLLRDAARLGQCGAGYIAALLDRFGRAGATHG
ncbi:MmgE/PrpD family protein [Falsiroseomonas sp. CW058]|uniref:MmgE/PrpD family protein n=1 Tax=Falsiroseomonas sp. CW058 TaxID=3388664 RepID=UPI003D31B494